MQEQIKFEREICKPTPRATIKNSLMFYYMVKERDTKISFHSKVQCGVVANKDSQSQFEMNPGLSGLGNGLILHYL